MARTALTLAALATAAVSGLDVEAAVARGRGTPGAFDSAELLARDGRRLIIRVPTSTTAESEQSADLVALASLTMGARGRLPFHVPTVIGQAPFNGSRAVVFDLLEGDSCSADALTARAEVAASVGRAIGAIHSLPTSLVADAGLPSQTAAESRAEVLSLIGRAADSGRLPAALLRRWEEATDDEALWRFAPCVVNGGLGSDSFLVVDDSVSAVLGWSGLRVGDPARDLHWLLGARGDAAEEVLNAYARVRSARMDTQLNQRALLYAELEIARWLVHGLDLRDPRITDDAAGMLDDLVENVHSDLIDPLSPPTGPIMAVTDVEAMLEKTPRERSERDAATTLHTDSYDPDTFGSFSPEARATDEEESGGLPMDLSGFGPSDRHENQDTHQRADGAHTPGDADDVEDADDVQDAEDAENDALDSSAPGTSGRDGAPGRDSR